jgi:hypothetical protein
MGLTGVVSSITEWNEKLRIWRRGKKEDEGHT